MTRPPRIPALVLVLTVEQPIVVFDSNANDHDLERLRVWLRRYPDVAAAFARLIQAAHEAELLECFVDSDADGDGGE